MRRQTTKVARILREETVAVRLPRLEHSDRVVKKVQIGFCVQVLTSFHQDSRTHHGMTSVVPKCVVVYPACCIV